MPFLDKIAILEKYNWSPSFCFSVSNSYFLKQYGLYIEIRLPPSWIGDVKRRSKSYDVILVVHMVFLFTLDTRHASPTPNTKYQPCVGFWKLACSRPRIFFQCQNIPGCEQATGNEISLLPVS